MEHGDCLANDLVWLGNTLQGDRCGTPTNNAAAWRSGQKQHGIAEAVEAIAKTRSFAVCAQDKIRAGERADEHEKCRFRKVEVRNKRVDGKEGVARQDTE